MKIFYNLQLTDTEFNALLEAINEQALSLKAKENKKAIDFPDRLSEYRRLEELHALDKAQEKLYKKMLVTDK